MASASMNEVDYLITCPICSCEYDELIQDLTPKFLSCSHTLCLQCLKKLQSSFFLACPLCRKILCPTGTIDISQVPTNTYALHILKSVKAERNKKNIKKSIATPNWCLTCGSIGKIDCPELHSTFDLSANTMASFEALLTMRESFSKIKEPIKTKIEESIQKEKEIQSYIDKLLKSLKSFEADVKKMEEESNLRLIELNSLLSSPDFSTGSKEEENEAFLSQLSSLAGSSRPEEETVEMLKKKMEESFKEMEVKLNSSSAELSEISELVNSTRITVKIFKDESDSSTLLPCPELLDKGFNFKWKEWSKTKKMGRGPRDIFLISHLILTIRNRHGKFVPLPSSTSIIAPPAASSLPFPHLYGVSVDLPAGTSQPIQRPLSAQEKGLFVLTINHSGIIKGQVYIRSVPWYPDFIQPLSYICLGNARPLLQPAGKAVPGCYVQIPLSLDGFQLGTMPSTIAQHARGPFEIGLMKKNGAKLSDPPRWILNFFLDKCQDPKYESHLKSMNPEPLFGHVVDGMEMLNALSGTSLADRPSYTFTIEYKQMGKVENNHGDGSLNNGELIVF